MSSSFHIDPVSSLVTCSASETLKNLEKKLNRKGYTLGYSPIQEGETLSLRALLDKKIENRYSKKYGALEDLCVSLKAKIHEGVFTTKNVPRAATGPDFKKILIGSLGQYGKILEVTLKIFPLPEEELKVRLQWQHSSGRQEFLKVLSSSGLKPVACLSEDAHILEIVLRGGVRFLRAELACVERLCRETEGQFFLHKRRTF